MVVSHKYSNLTFFVNVHFVELIDIRLNLFDLFWNPNSNINTKVVIQSFEMSKTGY